MGADSKIGELGLILPPPPKPVATYVTALLLGDLLHVSGHGPLRADGTLIKGKVGVDLDIEAGRAAAKQTGLAVLATVRDRLGSLDDVVRLVKVLGMVNCSADFTEHPRVINGFSDLMVEIFGESGKAARSAVGMVSLPGGIAVEIEAIFQVKTVHPFVPPE